MLKLLKYEFKKNKVILIGCAAVFVVLELYYMGAYFLNKDEHMGTAAVLLMLSSFAIAAIIVVLGIKNYRDEITSRSGYMIFMTPNSALKIVISKIVYVLVLGVLSLVIIAGTAMLDIYILVMKFNETMGFMEIFHEILEMLHELIGLDFSVYIGTVILAVFQRVFSLLAVITVAFLAITLASTFLQNNRFNKLISFVIFVALMVLVNFIEYRFVNINIAHYDFDINLIGRYLLPNILYDAVIMIASVFGCAALIDKAINL